MSREDAVAKARRYLAEGRLLVTGVSGDHVTAACRGDGEIYRLATTPATAGGVPAPPALTTASRDGRILIRAPSSSTCTLAWSAQMVTCRPAGAGPSQICWPLIHSSPTGAPPGRTPRPHQLGTPPRREAPEPCSRQAPRAAGHRRQGLAAAGPSVLGASWAGTRSPSGDTEGVNRSAGKPIDSDWCGRLLLYSARQASRAACSASMLLERATHIEQPILHGLGQPLDLPGGRRQSGPWSAGG